MKVLIVEDDVATAEMVRNGLASYLYTTDVSFDGADGSFMARSYEYDAIVLDHSLPKKSGLTVCKDIRAAGKTTPIIFLSGLDAGETKIEALEQGADDYMTHPFSLDELDARLKALARRPIQIQERILQVHDLTLDTQTHVVTRGGKTIHMTKKEFGLLEYIMKHKGIVLSRTSIIEHVWAAENDPFSNTVEAHLRNLRKKINFGNKPDLIRNLPGRGYIIDTPEHLARL